MSYWKLITHCKTYPNYVKPDVSYQKLGFLNVNHIGIGSTVGFCVFILTGYITRNIAGPSVILSIAIAAICALLTGLYYAELRSRITKNGSAYIFSYVCIGEYAAFITGWNLILEYIIGMAAVSKSLMLHIDDLLNDTLKLTFIEICPINATFFSNYFDLFAFTIPILLGVLIVAGYKKSDVVNNLFAIISIAVVLFIIIAGAFKAHIGNWYAIPLVESDTGTVDFFPYTIFGTIRGAAILSFVFIGFDYITISNRNGSNRSGFITFIIIFASLLACGLIFSLIYPYHLLDEYPLFPQIFYKVGWEVGQWLLLIGAILLLLASLCALMFPIPYIICLMAEDGLIFKFFITAQEKINKPIIGTLCAAFISSLFAGLFKIGQLIDLLSIGTLLAFFMVAISIILLRYSHNIEFGSISTIDVADSGNLHNKETDTLTCYDVFANILSYKRHSNPSKSSYLLVVLFLILLCGSCLGLGLMIRFANDAINELETWALTVTVIFFILILLFVALISLQPMQKSGFSFTVPFVPLLPALSIFLNIYLMLMLNKYAWIRLLIWMLIGIPMYLICICYYNRYERNIDNKTFGKHSVVNNGFIDDAENHGSTAFERSETSYKVEDPQEIEDKDNIYLNDELKNEVETIPIGVAENKSEEKQNIEVVQPTKQRTPSPSNSLDDIVLCSEIVDSLTEKKEPNGKIYFVDDHKSERQNQLELLQKSTEDSEQNTAIALLDEVLQTEEISSEKIRKISEDYDRAIKGAPVIAMIHMPSNTEENEQSPINLYPLSADSKSTNNSNVVEDVDQEELDKSNPITITPREINTPDYVSEVNNLAECNKNKSEIQVFPALYKIEKENDQKINIENNDRTVNERDSTEATSVIEPNTNEMIIKTNKSAITKDEISNNDPVKSAEIVAPVGVINTEKAETENIVPFKERLALLLGGQNSINENMKKTYNKIDDINDKPNDFRMKHSKSEPDIMRLVLRDIRAKNFDMEDTTKIEIPRAKLISNSQKTAVADKENSNIPPPPKFDPVIYKTVGAKRDPNLSPIRPNLSIALNLEYIKKKNNSKSNIDELLISAETDTLKASESDTNLKDYDIEDTKQRMISIKNKLENILKRGPQNRFSRPQSLQLIDDNPTSSPLPPSEAVLDAEAIEDDSEIVKFKEAKQPFDTVHKQKVLFDDVLKSISADARPSLLRASSPKKLTNPIAF